FLSHHTSMVFLRSDCAIYIAIDFDKFFLSSFRQSNRFRTKDYTLSLTVAGIAETKSNKRHRREGGFIEADAVDVRVKSMRRKTADHMRRSGRNQIGGSQSNQCFR